MQKTMKNHKTSHPKSMPKPDWKKGRQNDGKRSKNDTKRAFEIHPKSAFCDSGSAFCDFGRIFEESDFWLIFDWHKNLTFGVRWSAKRRKKGAWRSGSADRAGSVWGFGVCRNRQKYLTRLWHPALRDGGGGFKGLRPTRRPPKWKMLKNTTNGIRQNISCLKVSRKTVSVMLISVFVYIG